ncbi:hypothetical protein CKN99_16255 [Carnobacterium maltaromaticum]|uniref:hypothetical protein n=1 Tax=Carnobacterium maltaromaticum TaxID=2751 RepID=UPI000705647B|nr:hypothetical protein [Carnobacterium maltaromaticum]KRN86937.1 hypothetical protein IV75_GL000994 [Carnobacterium maltaromaticum]MDT1945087.1 hypothetical protein [Carnobacterium maltaromaticum]MDT1999458.1 hypothetical protein [Carnobacterium maltaromaticum]TFJ23358.1 hypothetical protein CKN90_16215 [Carnobacterium maltaromaticum]TFJ29040.1 hypothetical protein CKN98_16220 [Carnobacterium maltaromaticum]
MIKVIPKAVKVENIANILKIEFDNGKTKYLKYHYVKEMSEALSPSKGKGKRANVLAMSSNMWLGSTFTIEDDGTIWMNKKDKYSPEELWENASDSIPQI